MKSYSQSIKSWNIQIKKGHKKQIESTRVNLSIMWSESWDMDNLIKKQNKTNKEA
jgi:hypothetical protein